MDKKDVVRDLESCHFPKGDADKLADVIMQLVEASDT